MGFPVDLRDEPAAQADPPIQRVFKHIAMQALQQKERPGKNADGRKQGADARLLLHPLKDLRRDEELRQIDRHADQGQQQHKQQHAFAVFPRMCEHPADVLARRVCWLCFLFGHVSCLLFLSLTGV